MIRFVWISAPMETIMRNFTVAARVWAGELSSAEYANRIRGDEAKARNLFARTHSMTLPELTEVDMERIRQELPSKIASLRR